MTSTADNIDAVNGSYIGQLGSGRINAFEALQCIGAFNVALDAGIIEVVNPSSVVCGNAFVPQVWQLIMNGMVLRMYLTGPER